MKIRIPKKVKKIIKFQLRKSGGKKREIDEKVSNFLKMIRGRYFNENKKALWSYATFSLHNNPKSIQICTIWICKLCFRRDGVNNNPFLRRI